MAILKGQKGRCYEVDVTSILNDRAEFYTLSIGCPPCERSLKYEARALGLDDVPEAKMVIREGRRFTTLPADDVKEFLELRSRARRTFMSYAMFFPFIPPSVVAIPKDRIPEMWDKMNEHYVEFDSLKAKLIDKLPNLKESRKAEYLKAGDAVFDKRHPKGPDGKTIERDVFLGMWGKVFDRWFPTVYDIEKEYYFKLEHAGTIQKTISIMTREEFMKDEETAAKCRIMADSEKQLKAQFTDWIAEVALNSRINLLRALEPVVNGLRDGRSVGKKELEKIERHIHNIRSMDVFGDQSFDAAIKMVESAAEKLRADSGAMEKAMAETNLQIALHKTETALQNLEFDPSNFRRLELDGDEGYAEVFADKDFMNEVSERMNANLSAAVKELADKHGGTDQEKKDAEFRLAQAVKLKKLADEGADEMAIGLAARASALDIDAAGDMGEAGAETDMDASMRAATLDIEDGEAGDAGAPETADAGAASRAAGLELD